MVTLNKKKRIQLLAIVAATAMATSGVGMSASHAAAQTVNIGISADMDKLDPHTSTNFATVRILGLVYSELVESTTGLQIVPGLAKSWYWNSTSTQLTMYMRTGVKFHDGTPFTAADAKASLERVKASGSAAGNLGLVTSIRASGAQLTINFSAPNAPFLAALDGVNMAMVSKADIDSGSIGKKVNGTGPYKFVSWTPGQSVKLTTNESYYKTVPKVAGLNFQIIPSESSILAALNAGTVDFAYIGNPLIAKQVGSGLTLQSQPSLSYHVLQLNARKAPFDNVNVRLAIQCAIDRQQVVDTAALGQGSVTGPFTMPAYKSSLADRQCPTADAAKAKKYLAAAGYPNGLTIQVMTEGGEYALATPIAQSVQSQLAKAGITVQLQPLDAATYIPKWLAGDFGAAVANNGGKVDPDTMYTRYFTSGGNLNKVAGYSSASLDSLFLQGKATGNPARRLAIYNKITHELENQAVWVWLFAPYDYYISSKKLTGFTPNPNGSMLELRNVQLG
jgi:peptide/nickel transport system substrate-binding protein